MPFNTPLKFRRKDGFHSVPAFKGEGVDFAGTYVTYCLSDDWSSIPRGPWTAEIPELQYNQCLWARVQDMYTPSKESQIYYLYAPQGKRLPENLRTPLKTVNGIQPDASGNVAIDWQKEIKWYSTVSDGAGNEKIPKFIKFSKAGLLLITISGHVQITPGGDYVKWYARIKDGSSSDRWISDICGEQRSIFLPMVAYTGSVEIEIGTFETYYPEDFRAAFSLSVVSTMPCTIE